MKHPSRVFSQALFFPLICILIALLGIISASASTSLYGSVIWSPVTLASYWTSPSGRLGAFYCGLAWTVAQLGVNISANCISFSNDATSLFPKYVNIQRASLLAMLLGGWVMVPWKIVTSAAGLLSFMDSLGIFLAPIIAISVADYWIVKRRRCDVPALYDPRGRYRYWRGTNWRAVVALLCAIGPTFPSLVENVDAGISIGGAQYVADLVWYFGFVVAGTVYVVLSKLFPAEETLVSGVEVEEIEGVDVYEEKEPSRVFSQEKPEE